MDKPEGPTSHDVVGRVRRLLDERRVGHTGTLDPFASGLLLLCVGRATRLAEYLHSFSKTYVADARLGQVTSTLDPEGEVVRESSDWTRVTPEQIRQALTD
ncbi:MAG: pseudouridine synthase, partial [Longimicrobiales bacterium]